MKTTTTLTHWMFGLTRFHKRLLMLATDLILLPLAVWLAFALRLGTWTPDLKDGLWLLFLAPLFSIPIFVKLGLYRSIVRFIGGQAMLAILQGVILTTLCLGIVAFWADWQTIPRSFYPIFVSTAFLLVGGSRYWIRRHYRTARNRQYDKIPVAIYGAGSTGRQLARVLISGIEYVPVLYLDDNPALIGSIQHGMRIYSPHDLPTLLTKYSLHQILLAIPSATPERRRAIINQLEPLPVHVRSVPNLGDLVSGKSSIGELHEIDIEDLLGRSPVQPNNTLLKANIENKNVLVTGAGGSIGSELCRQIIQLAPAKLVLFELSEFALYTIERELLETMANEGLAVPVIPVLGSVQDRQRVEQTLRQHAIQTLYHAAAYKHVPMVEHNPIEGVRNNTLGTYHTAQAALNAGVERFVLISTDKAVRPTNVMGASKRLAELVLQGFALQAGKTVFCMVRFGNVLGSSGSVVPLFRRQIREGGPITVTHPDIIRYFMTIPEAAQLVIQAGAMAQGGEVFLLDMGEPVKILDLAKRMIRLSGLQLQDEHHPNGQIRIEFSGLRPGEKLYEELLIDSEADKTHHPRVFQARESHLPWAEVQALVTDLQQYCQHYNMTAVYRMLSTYVHGYAGKPVKADQTSNCNVVPLPQKHEKFAKPLPSLAEV